MNFGDHSVKTKESEKNEKYLVPIREIKNKTKKKTKTKTL